MPAFRITIDGRNVTPATVPLEDLLDVLRVFRDAVVLAAVDAGEAKADVFLSLIAIGEGSNALTINESEAAQVGTNRIATAIRERDFATIPAGARKKINKLWTKAQTRVWTIAVENSTAPAVIDPSTAFPEPTFVKGTTTICAHIIRAGGARPTALLRLPDGTKRTFRVASKGVAEQLGNKLYRTVTLEGKAAWAVGSWKLAAFTITGVGRYDDRAADPSAAMSRLKKIAAGRWDNVDPDQYVHEQRDD